LTCKKEVNIRKNTARYLSGIEGEFFHLVLISYSKLIGNTNLDKSKEIFCNGEEGVGLIKYSMIQMQVEMWV